MIGLLTPAEYVDCVEHAFRMHGLGRVYMEPKGHIVLDRYRGEWEVMPSYIEEPEAAACKWVSIREDNAKYELPAVFSILVYTHPETGFPLAICDGSFHTLMRTGASAAVSAKWLARQDASVLAVLGTGSVGEGTLAGASHAAADLVGLRETQQVRALDDQRVGLRNVEPGLDDRRRDEAVRVAAQELEHRPLELAGVHLAVGFGIAHSGRQRA